MLQKHWLDHHTVKSGSHVRFLALVLVLVLALALMLASLRRCVVRVNQP